VKKNGFIAPPCKVAGRGSAARSDFADRDDD
jgi:hypothetical protein